MLCYCLFLFQNSLVGIGHLFDALLNYRAGDLSRAQHKLEEAIEWGTDFSHIYNNLAFILALKRIRLDEALKYARLAYSRSSNNVNFKHTYGWLLFLNGEHEKSLEYLHEAYRKKRNNKDIMVTFGIALAKTKNSKQAYRILRKWLYESNYSRRNRLDYKEVKHILNDRGVKDEKRDDTLSYVDRLKEYRSIMASGNYYSDNFFGLSIVLGVAIVGMGLLAAAPGINAHVSSVVKNQFNIDPFYYIINYALSILLSIFILFQSILAIRFMIKRFSPGLFLAPLLLSDPPVWNKYINKTKDIVHFEVMVLPFFLFAIIIKVIPYLVDHAGIELLGEYFRVLLILSAFIPCLYSVINTHKKTPKPLNKFSREFSMKSSLISTIMFGYVTAFGVIFLHVTATYYADLIHFIIYIQKYTGTFFDLKQEAIVAINQKVVTQFPELSRPVTGIIQEVLKVGFDIPVVVSTTLILGHGILCWEIKNWFIILFICIISTVAALLIEGPMTTIITGNGQQIAFAMPQITAFTVTLVLAMFASPSRGR
jgi:hypothetical protein